MEWEIINRSLVGCQQSFSVTGPSSAVELGKCDVATQGKKSSQEEEDNHSGWVKLIFKIWEVWIVVFLV